MTETLTARYNIALEDWSEFSGLFSIRHLEQNEHWVQVGDNCSQFSFIVSGLVRVYYIDFEGNEKNEGFYDAEDMIGPISSIVSGEPCQYCIQALEATTLLVTDYIKMHEVGYKKPDWLRFEIKLLQQMYLRSAKREAKLLLGSAEQRYKWFCNEYPDLVKRLTQYHIASYLGVTAVTLSRLRKKTEQTQQF